MYRAIPLAALLLLASPAAAEPGLPAESVVDSVKDPRLQALLVEILEANPSVAAARARLRAAEARPLRLGAKPDPVASVTAFLLQPETRVGPQQLALSLSQRFPGFGRLALAERAAVEESVAVAAELEERKLAAVTEARRWYYELAFHDDHEHVLRTELGLLRHFEEIARSRYASGVGLQAAPLQLQAQVTKMELELLRLQQARSSALAALNALRAEPASRPVGATAIPAPTGDASDGAGLVARALQSRPALVAARASIEAAGTRVELARRARKPSFTVGLGYTLVDGREDAAGRAAPPEGNGDDILAVSTAFNLPVRGRAIDAGIEEAIAGQEAARHELRALVAALERDVADHATRVRLLGRQERLFEDVLLVQAEEALRSVEDAYSNGATGALDLLDATRVLYEVQLAAARTRTDRAIAQARLEGAMGAPLASPAEQETKS
jgi:outer membrane protein TolC